MTTSPEQLQTRVPSRNGMNGSNPGARSRVLWALAFALAGVAAVMLQDAARAQSLEGGPITKAEWELLPKYCVDTQGFKYGKGQSPNSAKWVALMGETFWSLHHYCLGIVKFTRAQKFGTPPVIRYGFLTSALGEFRFVTNSMPKDYILAPEIYTYVGRTHLLLNQPKEADAAFSLARSIKPDYWPAYSWWATYLVDHGQTKEARDIVTQGLAHAPQSRTLQLIMRDLNAKESKPDADATSAQR